MIVCIEGLDGLGKSTQCALLAARLKAKLWKFPNKDTPTGKLIYEHLEGKWCTWTTTTVDSTGLRTAGTTGPALRDALVFQALQVANRMEVATELMRDASTGNVVMDRYWPSGYAYGKADGLDGEYLINLHRWLPQPDVFILLDGDPDTSAYRRPERRDRYEKDALHLQKVTENYRELWGRNRKAEPRRWRVVNARQTVEEVSADINAIVAAYREATP